MKQLLYTCVLLAFVSNVCTEEVPQQVEFYSIKINNVLGTSATASWEKPRGKGPSYELILTGTPATPSMTPGTQYAFTVGTTDGTTESPSPESVKINTLPQQVEFYSIQITNVLGTSATASWEKPRGKVSSYELTLTGTPATPGMTFPASVTAPTVALSNLSRGITYTLTIQTKTSGVLGATQSRSFVTPPNAVDFAKITTQNLQSRSTNIVWEEPAGNFDYYFLDIDPRAGLDPYRPAKGIKKTAVMGLKPGTTYTFKIATAAGSKRGAPKRSGVVSKIFTTQPAKIARVSIAFSAITLTTATVSWGTPESGDWSGYGVTISPTAGGASVTVPSPPKGTRTTALTSLTPGTKYRVKIRVKVGTTTPLFSAEVWNEFETSPPIVSGITFTAITTTSATVSWTEPTWGTFAFAELSISPSAMINLSKTSVPRGTTTSDISRMDPGKTYVVSIKLRTGDGKRGDPVSKLLTTR